MGFIVAFSYSYFLCTSVKLYILLSVLIIGMTGYCIVEYLIRLSKSEGERTEDSPLCSETKSYDAVE